MKKRVILSILALVMIFILSGCKMSDYKEAQAFYADGDFTQAKQIFDTLSDYKDSPAMSQDCQTHLDYISANEAMASGNYIEAITLFEKCASFEDSQECIDRCNYSLGDECMAEDDFNAALIYFDKCVNFEDSAEKIDKCRYYIAYYEACDLKYGGSYDEAYDAYTAIAADGEALDCKYLEIFSDPDLYEADPDELYQKFSELGTYRDSDELASIFLDISNREYTSAAEKINVFLQTSDELPEYSWWEDYFWNLNYDSADEFLKLCAAQQLLFNAYSSGYYSYGYSEPDLSLCSGTDGRIIVCCYDHAMSYDSTCISESSKYLPYDRIPQSLEEVQYAIMIEDGHDRDCTYTSGTTGVRLWTKIYIIEYPSGKTIKTFGTAYGDYPPYSFSYSGSAPAYKSGGRADADEVEAMYEKALDYLSVYQRENGCLFSVYNDEATLLDVDSELTEIPETLGGYPLVKICKSVYCCTSEAEIALPDTLRVFSSGLFGSINQNIRKITLPSALYMIPEYAFDNCIGLEEVVIPEGVNCVGEHAFNSCYELHELILPSSMKILDLTGLEYTALENISLNDGLRYIYGFEYYDDDYAEYYEDALLSLLEDDELYETLIYQMDDYIAAVQEDSYTVLDVPDFMYDNYFIFEELIETVYDLNEIADDEEAIQSVSEVFVEQMELLKDSLAESKKLLDEGESESVSEDESAKNPCFIPGSVAAVYNELPQYFNYGYEPHSYAEWLLAK